MPYKSDHIKVLKVLAAQLPKRPSMKTSDIVEKAFKKDEDGDRRVRNCYRMLRKYKHIEIADRGDYRITPAGQTFYEKLAKNGFKIPAPEKAEKKAPSKAKVAKKKAAVKKASKPAAKKAPVKKAPVKKAPAKKESKPAKPVNGKPTNGKSEKPAPKAAKPAESKPAESKASSSQLTF